MKTNDITLYHGSRKALPIGTILISQSGGYTAGDDAFLDPDEAKSIALTEKILESRRPAAAPNRMTAVYLSESSDPDQIEKSGGYANYVYEVVPVNKPHRCNLYWYSEIYALTFDKLTHKDRADAEEYARNYWNATPGQRDNYEYLTDQAKIVRKVSN